jgi:hypothetical protein
MYHVSQICLVVVVWFITGSTAGSEEADWDAWFSRGVWGTKISPTLSAPMASPTIIIATDAVNFNFLQQASKGLFYLSIRNALHGTALLL